MGGFQLGEESNLSLQAPDWWERDIKESLEFGMPAHFAHLDFTQFSSEYWSFTPFWYVFHTRMAVRRLAVHYDVISPYRKNLKMSLFRDMRIRNF